MYFLWVFEAIWDMNTLILMQYRKRSRQKTKHAWSADNKVGKIIIILLASFVEHCGAFCRLKWRIWQAYVYKARWNKPMESENQIILQRKQPIKIEKVLKCFLPFFYGAGERNILQAAFVHFQFYSPNAFQSDNNSNTVYVLGHKYILGPSQSSFLTLLNGLG